MRNSKLARKTIFFSRLHRNIGLIRDRLGEKKLAFVVKSDAYGHGIEEVSAYVDEKDLVDYLAVVSLAEARAIREAGVEIPVLMLTPPTRDQLKSLVSLNVELTVDRLQVAREADKIAGERQKTLSLHVPVDTGMGRFGVFPDEAVDFLFQLAKLDNLRIIGVYSHCSSAYSQEEEDKKYTEGQIATFRGCLEKLEKENLLPPLRHIANSGAFKGFRKQVTRSPLNMVRLGSLVYGCIQSPPEWGESIIPVMEFTARIIELRELPSGRYVSYERTFKTSRKTTVGILPVGYCDGYDRRLSNKAEVRIGDSRAPVIGKVGANHTMIDLTGLDNVQVGDTVTIYGKDPTLTELANLINGDTLKILASDSENISRFYKEKGDK